MKTIIALAALLAVAAALPPKYNVKVFRPQPAVPQHHQVVETQHQVASPAHQVVVVRENPSNNIGLDGYQYSYELSDGQKRDESAQVEVRSAEEAVLRVRGSYSWVNPEDGQTYSITYVADENGFQPQGAHLPVA